MNLRTLSIPLICCLAMPAAAGLADLSMLGISDGGAPAVPPLTTVPSQTAVPSCRPAEAPIPSDFDPKEIFLGSRPAILPDGKQFVFEWCDTLWVAPTEGGVARLLQHSNGDDVWPVVSRDGKQVAFQSNRSGSWQVYVADLSEQSVASQVTFHSEGARPLLWSHDDSELLCYTVRDDRGSAFEWGRLAWISVDGRRAERRLFDAHGDEPSLSPDGRLLLFTREGEGLYRKGFEGENAARIWCYDLEKKTFELVVKHPTESETPIWAPDGKGFYYISGQDGTRNVWYRTYPEGKERQVTFFRGDSVIAPTLSADGKTMIFRQGFWFYTIDPTQPGMKPNRLRLYPESRGVLQQPHKRRAFDEVWNCDGPGCLTTTSGGLEFAFTAGGDLWVMDTVLREPQCVYGDARTHERDCVFSADGSKLYFLSDRGTDVALLAAEKKYPARFWWENNEFIVRPLVEDAVRRSQLTLSPDGTRLAWVERNSVIAVADTDGKVIRRFPPHQAIGSYDWSPDGRWLVASLADEYENLDIWLLPIDDHTIEPYNLSRSFSWDGNPRWSPDGKLIIWQGDRPDTGLSFFYVWLNRQDEEDIRVQPYRKAIETMGATIDDRPVVKAVLIGAKPNSEQPQDESSEEKAGDTPAAVSVDLKDLYERVHQITGVTNSNAPYFSYDSRRIFFPATINGRPGTYEITIPDRLTPKFVCETWGHPVRWYSPKETKDGKDRLVWLTGDRQVAAFTKVYPFRVYQDLDMADYYELGFLSAWGQLNDAFYDIHFHGADWEAVRDKYRVAARYAPSRSVFMRIMNALNGELNASHTGFYDTDDSLRLWGKTAPTRQDWAPVTSHLGILFDPNYQGKQGWLVSHIIAGGPADSPQVGLKPGDLVMAIDRTPVNPDIDPTLLLNGPAPGKFVLTVRSGGEDRLVYIEAITYGKARELMHKEARQTRREYVHERSGGRFGYVTIERMNDAEYYRFEQEIFAEGFNRDGMIIDVRDNTGGFTADRVLNILGVARHSWSVARNGRPGYLAGYWGRPVFDRPIVVLCNQNTVSNGEIFSHAIKQLGRGRLVGIQTNGGVIATTDKPLLDLGKLRHPRFGWYTLDGTDMEMCGAMPDIIVDNTPGDIASGQDPQLDAAIQSLTEEVSAAQQRATPFSPHPLERPHSL